MRNLIVLLTVCLAAAAGATPTDPTNAPYARTVTAGPDGTLIGPTNLIIEARTVKQIDGRSWISVENGTGMLVIVTSITTNLQMVSQTPQTPDWGITNGTLFAANGTGWMPPIGNLVAGIEIQDVNGTNVWFAYAGEQNVQGAWTCGPSTNSPAGTYTPILLDIMPTGTATLAWHYTTNTVSLPLATLATVAGGYLPLTGGTLSGALGVSAGAWTAYFEQLEEIGPRVGARDIADNFTYWHFVERDNAGHTVAVRDWVEERGYASTDDIADHNASTTAHTNVPAFLTLSGLTGAITVTNYLETPVLLSGTGALTVAFSGLRTPRPIYTVMNGFTSVTFPTNTYLVGGGSWQTNRSNHFLVWSYGSEIFVNPITTSE